MSYTKEQLIGFASFVSELEPAYIEKYKFPAWGDEFIPEDVRYWIDNWLNLFPKGIKSGGKLVRSDRAGCIKKMQKFLKENKYPPSLILEATEEYIREFEQRNFMYMLCATYFIDRQGVGSELAARCADMINTDKTEIVEQENFFG